MLSYANLKIRNKLTLGFSVVVFMALAIGIFGYFQIHKLERADNVLFSNGVKPMEHIGNIAANFQRLRVNIREFIFAGNRETLNHYEGRIIRIREEIDHSVEKLETALPDIKSKKLFAALIQTRNGYTPHVTRIVELTKPGNNKEAVRYLKSTAVDAAEHAEIEAIENLQNYLVENAEIISEHNVETATTTGVAMLCLAIFSSLLAAIMTILITRSITKPLRTVLNAVRSQQEGSKEKARLVEAIAGGDLSKEVAIVEPLKLDMSEVSFDETGMLLKEIAGMSEVQYFLDRALTVMTRSLRHNREQDTLRDWFKNGQNELNTVLRGDKSTAELTEQALAFLTEYIGAGTSVFYIFDEKEATLQAAASYALTKRVRLNERIALGEGVAGQAALQRKMICLNTAPTDYLPISSALGKADPAYIVVLPLLHNGVLYGILEFGSFNIFSGNDLEFLNQSKKGIAIALSVNKSRQRVNELLEQTQVQAEELRVQQEELQQTNEELEERAQMLEQKRELILAKNREVEETGRELQRKAVELERVSTYKSEFLANMSHELRTPLNSLMILSSLLKDNREGNLTDKQVEFAATINGAGRDLLNLINDILDLSKIESGHLEFHYEDLSLSEICIQLETTFTTIAGDKGIGFSLTIDESAPEIITTDGQRTQQILKNLLSNACKFTAVGSVSLRSYTPDSIESPLKSSTVAFAVTDTGIGIPDDKQLLIFNAFQQADGSTSRTYGGTGLGLSISRQLARSMGGEIVLTSVAGMGSTFTLYLPVNGCCDLKPIAEQTARPRRNAADGSNDAPAAMRNYEPLPAPIPDDREQLRGSGGRSILVIEDDLTFAAVLVDMVHGRGFLALVAADGESGIALAEQYKPSAIIS